MPAPAAGSIDLDPDERALAQGHAGGSAQDRHQFAEVRVVTDQEDAIRAARVIDDRVDGLEVQGGAQWSSSSTFAPMRSATRSAVCSRAQHRRCEDRINLIADARQVVAEAL